MGPRERKNRPGVVCLISLGKGGGEGRKERGDPIIQH